jgi:hypothetical protein
MTDLQHMRAVDAALIEAAESIRFVLVPGLNNSGSQHWQTEWQLRHAFWQRMQQQVWNQPDVHRWMGSIRRLLGQDKRPAILVGHSFGALSSCCLAAAGRLPIAGLMLVAPAEPVRFEIEEIVPTGRLGVPAMVAASRNDPLMPFERAIWWSAAWGADLVDLGEAGHVNAQSGFGPWPYGLEVLLGLVRKIKGGEPGAGP